MSLYFPLQTSKKLQQIQVWGHLIIVGLCFSHLPLLWATALSLLLAYSYYQCRQYIKKDPHTLHIRQNYGLIHQGMFCHITAKSYIQPYLCILHIRWENEQSRFWLKPQQLPETNASQLNKYYLDYFWQLKNYLYPYFAYQTHYLVLLPDMLPTNQDFKTVYGFLYVQLKPHI